MAKLRHDEYLPRLLWLALSALVLCLGCSEDDREDDSAAFRQREFWESHGVSSYSYQLQQGCFCDPITNRRVLIVVASDTISSVRDVHADTLISADYWNRFKTIDQLFDVVLRAEREADRLEVEYDLQYGFPSSIDIYWDISAMDNEWIAEATDFEVLQARSVWRVGGETAEVCGVPPGL